MELAQGLRARWQADRAATIGRFKQDRSVGKLLTALRRDVDRIVVDAVHALELPRSCSVIAVGGYGRGELFPRSDVDLLLLLGEPLDDAQTQRLTEFISMCWDIGLEIGHSVRTLHECIEEAERDVTVQTSLLECRYLAGSHAAYSQLRQALSISLDPRRFFQAKLFEMRQRHARFQDTPFSLEPNCKESPGGLRDLQVILWVARAAGLGTSWRALKQRGLITAEEETALVRNERVLKTLRARLHILCGRREDRLVFDVQTALAHDIGAQPVGTRRASEVLMQRYYWAAKAVVQLNRMLLQNIEQRVFDREDAPAIPIDGRFNNVNDLLDIAHDDVFEREPSAILAAFRAMQDHPELKGMSTRTMRALWHARTRIDRGFRADPKNRALFLAILQAPRGVVHELRRMNDISILGHYLPVFRRIIGQMQHDLFHAYTVDQHILTVIRNVRRFTMAEHAHEYPFCSQLIANFENHWLLYAAALFHDIAKGRGGDHSELGMVEVRRFARDHGLAADDIALLEFLVEHHLTMSRVAQKQDLSDPDVIASFAQLVGTERKLVALYLLTVADIRGTSPKVWNAWKGKLLEDLFRLTQRALSVEGVVQAFNPNAEYAARQQEARRILRLYAFSDTVHEELWRQLDVAFFLRQDPQTVAWLTRALHYRIDAKDPVVVARPALIGDGMQIAVYVHDQPDLFARICGYFDAKRYSILDAKVHTTLHGYALDTFLVVETHADRDATVDYRTLSPIVERELAQTIALSDALPEPSQARLSRLSRHFPIQPGVDLQADERGQYYLLSISAADRSGLLYAIARVLARYRIAVHTAKIMTLGERVEDVFLIEGPALAHNKTQLQLEADLSTVLQVR